MIIKLKKTEINTLFKEINISKPEYGLIYSLIYIYARQAKEVLCLQKKHVNIKKNIITFNVNNKTVTFPLIATIKPDLQGVLDTKKRDEYLFLDVDDDVNLIRRKLHHYLNTKTGKLNRIYNWNCDKLSLTDLRKLRAQHLLLDGVNLDVIQKLFLNNNISEFKEFIDYDDLIAIKFPCDSLDGLFNEYTNMDVYSIDGYNHDELFTCVDSKGEECTIISCLGKLDVIEYNDVARKVFELDEYKLVDQLAMLNPGEYTVIGDLKFFKY